MVGLKQRSLKTSSLCEFLWVSSDEDQSNSMQHLSKAGSPDGTPHPNSIPMCLPPLDLLSVELVIEVPFGTRQLEIWLTLMPSPPTEPN